ncbi:MAG: hypothetical protein CVT48_01985 [Thermoplasmata archaeon HGW-Thermoplasmata-1]|nr:MAG: hypothetical protein CVT48_01985 [Thermoplasmata archaeon HGW-Thermoplasmata-1]
MGDVNRIFSKEVESELDYAINVVIDRYSTALRWRMAETIEPAEKMRKTAAEYTAKKTKPAAKKSREGRESQYFHGDYGLYTKEVLLRGGRPQAIYFFSKHGSEGATPAAMPVGYLIGINPRSNLPYLKKGEAVVKKAAKQIVVKNVRRNPDDLKLIKGIGGEYEKRLNAAGIRTYEDLLMHKPKELEMIAAQGHFGNRPAQENWKAQAKRLISKRDKKKNAGPR